MNSVYESSRWSRLRDKVLKRDNYIDQYLKRYGKIKEANLVHHIFPVEYFPEYRFEEWNLISISKATHNLLHNRNTGELTDKGLELVSTLCRKRNMEIPSRLKCKKDVKRKIKALYDPPIN